MLLAQYQHMSILEFNLIIKQHILILCKKATHVIKLGFALRFISTRAICLPQWVMQSVISVVCASKICSPVSTDLFVCTVHCEPFPPPPLAAIHIIMRAQTIFPPKKQVLGILPILINYCIQLQKHYSGAVDQSRDRLGEVMSSILPIVGFFSVDTFFSKKCFLT